MDDKLISVAQINNYIKGIFDNETLLKNICVYGEVSSYNVSNNVAYFNLKYEDNMLSCVLFGASKYSIPSLGDMVIVKGSVSYYAKGGRLSFNAISIAPYGKGVIYEQFLLLKAKLEAEGLFSPDHKIPIPQKVRRIGVVTSETGAVIQDIIDVTTRRNNTIDIVLFPVKVQGIGAEIEIAKGINFFSNYDKVDVVIVARGGGSLEDLQPFNTEIVARATFDCAKPIVSAVGHETDFTIIDFVSDLRAPTPSAAAELVAWDKRAIEEDIYKDILRMDKALQNMYLFNSKIIENSIGRMENILNNKLLSFNNAVTLNLHIMQSNIDSSVVQVENKINMYNLTLNKMNPQNILDKGYIKVYHNNENVKSVEKLKIKDTLVLQFADGSANSEIVDISKRRKQ